MESPSKYARKCQGFPRTHILFLTHNMARPPKNMLATAFRVSPKRNRRKNGWRHIIWQNPLRQHWHHLEGHINRLKMVKRHMFGRARLDLLSRRFIRAPDEGQAQAALPRAPAQEVAAAA